MNRREFVQSAAFAAAAGAPRNIRLRFDAHDSVAASRPVQWALGELRAALSAKGFGLNPKLPAVFTVTLASAPGPPESLTLTPSAHALLATGADARGLMYAVLELADRVRHAADPLAALRLPRPITERPANVIRSIARGFTSEIEDKPWLHDRSFWPPYLGMLAAQRFNRFSLTLGLHYDFPRAIRDSYLYFAYPFLLDVPGYDVRVPGLAAAERETNLAMLRFISEETAARGLDFQLGLWTHAYQWIDSPNVNYVIEGLPPARHAAYCRDALTLLLRECPAITGLTFRIHGESGVAEGSYKFWKAVFEGVARAGRKIEIDMHAKGMDQGMIDLALASGMPVNISPKYWAEHMGLPYHQAAIRELERPRENRGDSFMRFSSGERSFLRYGYGDLLRRDRRYGVLHRIWPGTRKFLLWGDPELAAGYGRASSFCGSKGVELCEPLFFKGRHGSGHPGGRCAYADSSLAPARDWEKYAYTYRVWGRLTYNPDAEPETWRRALAVEYPGAGEAVESALSHATRILPLVTTSHGESGSNQAYWPEIFTDLATADAERTSPIGDTPK
ncbi:MAG: hypothetical protein NTY38_02050, partial [Acidobacteria bacterium]|nr:hypothetical protein [Acidobacteriota bacterium]